MANKRINFRELRKITGIGWREFLWDLPKKLIGSMVVGLTGGQRVLQVGGLMAGLATAAGAVTALGIYVVGIAGGIFTALSISVGIYSLIKQSRARAKKIDMVVGKDGTVNTLKTQIALLAKNLSLNYENLRPEDINSLHNLLFSLHNIEGETITAKLSDLYDLTDVENLATEMSKILNDQTDPEIIEKGLRILNSEYETSSFKLTMLAAEKNAVNTPPLTTFEKVGVFLKAGLVALAGSLSGFGIVVGIASLAGVTIATGGAGLIVLVAACAAALLGVIIFTAATKNAQERKKRFEQEDKAVADLVQTATINAEMLNTAIHSAKPENNLSDVVEQNKRLESENQRLKQELEALRSQPVDQEIASATAQRAPQNLGIFPTPRNKRPPPPDSPAPEPPVSAPRSPKESKG